MDVILLCALTPVVGDTCLFGDRGAELDAEGVFAALGVNTPPRYTLFFLTDFLVNFLALRALRVLAIFYNYSRFYPMRVTTIRVAGVILPPATVIGPLLLGDSAR